MSPRWEPRTTEERFWAKVDKTGDCWLWTAAVSEKGYGRFKNNGVQHQAHHLTYVEANGPITAGLIVDHICHKPACVRPSHLRLVTNKQNQENRRGAQINSKSGVRGVYWHQLSNKWIAQVKHHGKTAHLGYFLRIEDAEAVVVAKRLELFTHNETDRRREAA